MAKGTGTQMPFWTLVVFMPGDGRRVAEVHLLMLVDVLAAALVDASVLHWSSPLVSPVPSQ